MSECTRCHHDTAECIIGDFYVCSRCDKPQPSKRPRTWDDVQREIEVAQQHMYEPRITVSWVMPSFNSNAPVPPPVPPTTQPRFNAWYQCSSCLQDRYCAMDDVAAGLDCCKDGFLYITGQPTP